MSKSIDPKYLGVPNICFSLTNKEDYREEKFAKQRLKRGFDDSETWCLASAISKFVLPRLKRFIEVNIIDFNNENEKEFGEAIPKMVKAFELVLRDDGSWIWTESEEREYTEGIDLFSKYFLYLWW